MGQLRLGMTVMGRKKRGSLLWYSLYLFCALSRRKYILIFFVQYFQQFLFERILGVYRLIASLAIFSFVIKRFGRSISLWIRWFVQTGCSGLSKQFRTAWFGDPFVQSWEIINCNFSSEEVVENRLIWYCLLTLAPSSDIFEIVTYHYLYNFIKK